MAATYFDHEQDHARPGLMWFLMAMIWVLPVVLTIAVFAYNFYGTASTPPR